MVSSHALPRYARGPQWYADPACGRASAGPSEVIASLRRGEGRVAALPPVMRKNLVIFTS
jgi:hypothetical protein